MTARRKPDLPGKGYNQDDLDDVGDTPELTVAELKSLRPFAEVHPALAASARRARGRQKADTKVLTSIRIDRDVLTAFRATGDGWQSLINAALKKMIPRIPTLRR